MSAWQPIGTAPREGVVLGYSPTAREHRRIVSVTLKNGKPFIAGGVFAFDLEPFTHWMPLPEAPSLSLSPVGVV